MIFNYYGPGWYRAELYHELENLNQAELDEVQVMLDNFSAGWMHLHIYVNGDEKDIIHLSAPFDPTENIKEWLEDIISEHNIISSLEIEEEGHQSTLVFERIQGSVSGVGKSDIVIRETMQDPFWKVEDLELKDKYGYIGYGPNQHFGYGIFYLYDSSLDTITAKAIVKIRDLVSIFYMAFLTLAGHQGASKKKPLDFSREWYYEDYYDDEDDDEGNHDSAILHRNNMSFYNIMKSPRIEWILSDSRRNWYRQEINKVDVTAVVHMWPEWGDGLFWVADGCCGNADSFSLEGTTYDLTSIEGLREWYDDMDNNGLNWNEDQWNSHKGKGYGLAKKIRNLLPNNIDLYYEWLDYKHEIEGVSKPLRLVPNTKIFTNKKE